MCRYCIDNTHCPVCRGWQVLLEAADKFASTYEDKQAQAARARVLGALQVTSSAVNDPSVSQSDFTITAQLRH